MKTIAMIAGVVVLAGCSTTGLPPLQASCERQHSDVAGIVACLHSGEVRTDNRYGAETKLYLLKADRIAERVKRGEMSEADGRIALQQAYVEWDRATDAKDVASASPIIVPQAKQTMSCTTWGNQTTCR